MGMADDWPPNWRMAFTVQLHRMVPQKRDVNGQVDILSHFIYPIPWGISDIKTMIIGDVTLW
jgi:hypothetical protein